MGFQSKDFAMLLFLQQPVNRASSVFTLNQRDNNGSEASQLMTKKSSL